VIGVLVAGGDERLEPVQVDHPPDASDLLRIGGGHDYAPSGVRPPVMAARGSVAPERPPPQSMTTTGRTCFWAMLSRRSKTGRRSATSPPGSRAEAAKSSLLMWIYRPPTASPSIRCGRRRLRGPYPSPNQRGFQILAPVDESDVLVKVVYQDGERLIIRHKVPK
jgi:hypothetical protein